MRLIDADALADALFDKRKNYPQWVADTIGAMPDAIVRCDNCSKRGIPDECPLCIDAFFYVKDMTKDDGFCFYAEKS